MSKKDISRLIDELVMKNFPFVIFREPNREARMIIQLSPLLSDRNLEIQKSGFYAFPFSEREKACPLFFAPDVNVALDELSDIDIDLNELPLGEAFTQKLYEVDKEEYINDLNKFLDHFENQGIKKAIYSRVDAFESPEGFDLISFFNQLDEKYTKAFVYAMHLPGDGLWIGASPELLLSYEQGIAKTVALAGTLKIDQKLSAPEWTRKEIDEHRLVEKYIISLCEKMDLDYTKSKVRTSSTGKVYHLKSDFDLSFPPLKIRKFLQQLHPTPAISGLPQDSSLDLIYSTESYDRAYYCGFLGYVEKVDDFKLFINLRCMKMMDNHCFLFAGGGITPDSDIEKEWEETKVKMSTLTDLLETDANYEEISPISC